MNESIFELEGRCLILYDENQKSKLFFSDGFNLAISLKTFIEVKASGTKTRLYLFRIDKTTGQIKLTEAKSSQTAPLTKNQKSAFPEIEKSGATVVGKRKTPFEGGTKIPPTKVDVERPKN